MSETDRFTTDMRAALKARDKVSLETLRLLVADLKNEEIRKGEDLEESEVAAILKRSLKRRREAAEMFRKGGRDDLADREEAQAAVLEKYLPQQLDGDGLETAVAQAIAETGATALSDLGAVMKALMAAHPGRVDGKAAQAVVRRKLGA